MPTTRREFFHLVSSSGIALTLFGCRSTETSGVSADGVQTFDAPTVTMQDILTEGWSTLGSGFLGNNGTLKAQLIKANKTTVLPYIQDSHGHTWTLTPADFAKLRKGEPVEVISTLEQGHRHIVKINPMRIVASSAAVTMPISIPDGDLPPPQTNGPMPVLPD